jgi:DNA polymerase-3 subunit gamma/tau
VTLHITVGESADETPARERQRQQSERLEAATAAIHNDPNVRALQEQFNARINGASIRPKG